MKRTENISNFIKSLITNETPVDDVQKYQDMINELDSIDNEIESTHSELVKCKDKIVDLVNTQGTSKPPMDNLGDKTPRSLEEIGESVINGGK